jgi:hypothetical protein
MALDGRESTASWSGLVPTRQEIAKQYSMVAKRTVQPLYRIKSQSSSPQPLSLLDELFWVFLLVRKAADTCLRFMLVSQYIDAYLTSYGKTRCDTYYTAIDVTLLLNVDYPLQRISWHVSTAWPPKSLDMNYLHVYLWKCDKHTHEHSWIYTSTPP